MHFCTSRCGSKKFIHASTFQVLPLNQQVFYIAEDPYTHGNLLLSLGTRLQTYNGSHTTPVVGSDNLGYGEGKGKNASFRWIKSFVSKNRTHIIAVDQYNHCLRYIDLSLSTSFHMIGQCKLSGSYQLVANATSAMFNQPTEVAVKDSVNSFQFFLADSMNDAIHILLLNLGDVLSTRLDMSVQLNRPEYLLFHSASSHLVVADQSGIWRINSKNSSIAESLISDNNLYDIQYSTQEPSSLLALSMSFNDIFVIRLDDGNMTSLCQCSNNDEWSTVCGLLDKPKMLFNKKVSLARDSYQLYIGQDSSIMTGLYQKTSLENVKCSWNPRQRYLTLAISSSSCN